MLCEMGQLQIFQQKVTRWRSRYLMLKHIPWSKRWSGWHGKSTNWFEKDRVAGTPERGFMTGALPTTFWKKGQRGHRCPYITVSQVISWFIKMDLKQIYCSYSRTQNSERLSIIYVIIFIVNIVFEHVNAKRMTIIVRLYTELKHTVLILWYVKIMVIRRGKRPLFTLEMGG